MQLLVTGATGKVGVNLIERLLSDPRWRNARVRALCHNRSDLQGDS
jgi:UDP-glucose 4-epimerase